MVFKIKYLSKPHNLGRSAFVVIPLLLALLGGITNAIAQADFTFAAFGDTPYTEDEEGRFVGMIAEINREQPAFTLHVGDFKSGWSPCSDAVFIQRRDWFTLFHGPLVYTPGDNEWSDCWRTLGAAHDPLERLQKLRSLFFSDVYSLGQQKILFKRQNGGYPEHALWVHEGVVFATLNVPGGNNNLRMPEEAAARAAMLQQWIESTFEAAHRQGHRAVVLVMQANPFVGGSPNGYAALLKTLSKESSGYKGEVLLIHGDTHRYRFDKPLIDERTKRPLRNFTRLEVFGYPFMNWVRVRVSQNNGRVTFAASPGG